MSSQPDQIDAGSALPLPEPDDRYDVDPFDPGVMRLQRYVVSTTIEPRPDLVSEVHARIAREPECTPPRRLVAAVGAHELGAVARALRQVLAVALGAGKARRTVRVQAAALLVAMLVITGVSGVAAFKGAGAGLDFVTTVAREVLSPASSGPGSPGSEPRGAGLAAGVVHRELASKHGQGKGPSAVGKHKNDGPAVVTGDDDDKKDKKVKTTKRPDDKKDKKVKTTGRPDDKKDKKVKTTKRPEDKKDKKVKTTKRPDDKKDKKVKKAR